MPEPFLDQADAGGLPGLPDGDRVPGLVGVVDLGGLEGVLDAAREGDEAAGDLLGEDSVSSVLPGAGSRWPAAELAAAAAEGMAPGQGLGYWAARFAPGQMSDYALPGAAAACRRLASWAQATELAVVAEVASRAAARDSSVPAGPGGLPARVPDEAAAEVALALGMSQYGASCWTDLAITLAGRLARTGAMLRDGTIDLTRARLIAEATSVLDDRAAKLAEEKVLPGAGAKTPAQLRAALRRAVISVDPDAAERRREAAERRAKVGLYGDEEGTVTLSGQNLPSAHAAAAMARITALARAMKASGAGGGIDLLRAQVYIGLLLGTLPLIPPADGAPPEPPPDSPDHPGDPDESGGPDSARGPDHPSREDPGPEDPGQGSPYWPDDLADHAGSTGPPEPDEPREPRDSGDPGLGGAVRPGCRARLPQWPGLPLPGQVSTGLAASGTGALAGLPRGPAGTGLLHLTVPWRTLAGLLAEPGQLTRLGAVTPHTARRLADTAARDPGAKWKIIITDSAGRAIAVGRLPRSRARSSGVGGHAAGLVSQVTLTIPADLARGIKLAIGAPAATPGPGWAVAQSDLGPEPPGWRAGQAREREAALNRILADALEAARIAVARAVAEAAAGAAMAGGCAHWKASPAYRPPPRLREFVAARDQTCRYPVCRQPAHRADQDHTIPYDQGGRTCACNIGGACRRHHQIKQRPGWQLTQPEPGTFTWKTPSGRTYTQTPDTYAA